MLSIDLNCDMGESTNLWSYSIEKDFELLTHISSANIACGYHAGDRDTMKLLAEAAIKNNVAIGAHPSFPDKENFGRSDMYLSRQRAYEIVLDQISLLNDIVKSVGSKLHHVKPHGALYNMAAKNSTLADAICKAVKDFDKDMMIYGLSGSNLIIAAEKVGLAACNEGFADRTYQEDGSLIPRREPNALIEDADEAAKRVLQMINDGIVTTGSGKKISIKAETVCIHGDGIHAIEFSKKINCLLRQNGVEIKAR
jgi:5-oxoprolinase (ATP-hydrolysing) subunit A